MSPATSADGLIPISMAMLTPKALLGIDVYLRSASDANPVLFFTADELPDLAKLTPFIKEGVNKLYIDRTDGPRYQEYLRNNWRDLVADETMPVTNRVVVMSEVIRDVLSEEFASGETEGIVCNSKLMAKGACEVVGDNPILAQQLCSVLHHDYTTFTHSTNVSLYCVLLARRIGFSSSDIEQIAVGGLLHDLGKLQIDERILTKPGRLDEFEFREIKKHPLTGFRALVQRDDITFGQLMMTYQHHERVDGTGYPVGCVSDEIHPWARLCAVCDVYEALTSIRPYRNPMSQTAALAVLEKGVGTEFDGEMVAAWKSILGLKGAAK